MVPCPWALFSCVSYYECKKLFDEKGVCYMTYPTQEGKINRVLYFYVPCTYQLCTRIEYSHIKPVPGIGPKLDFCLVLWWRYKLDIEINIAFVLNWHCFKVHIGLALRTGLKLSLAIPEWYVLPYTYIFVRYGDSLAAKSLQLTSP
jgi:hypothetical protein